MKNIAFMLADGAAQRILTRSTGTSCVEPPKFRNADLLQTKHTGFTLAEVLITLGIIGVVAAITIPGLINNYKAHKLRSSFLKNYSIIQQVFKQMENDDVSLALSDYAGNSGSFYQTFKNYLAGAQECGTFSKKEGGCYKYSDSNAPYKNLTGNKTISKAYFDDGQLVLPDGTLLAFEQPAKGTYVWVFADINGYKNPPNKLGYDLFCFQFMDGELRTMGDRGTSFSDHDKFCSLTSNEVLNGMACSNEAKTNSDYFKAIVKKIK